MRHAEIQQTFWRSDGECQITCDGWGGVTKLIAARRYAEAWVALKPYSATGKAGV